MKSEAHEPCAYNPASSHQEKAPHPELSDTAAYRAFVRRQLGELLTNYGPIYTLFWDIPPGIDDPSINAYARSLQPDILINDRGYDPGDFSTPERTVPEGRRFTRMTEACQSVGVQSWGFRREEDYFTPRALMSAIDRTMAMGGSYLLNVGPTAEGRIPPEARLFYFAVEGRTQGDPDTVLHAATGVFTGKTWREADR